MLTESYGRYCPMYSNSPQTPRYISIIYDYVGGSNYDSLFVRTVAFPVQVAYWIKEVIAPCGYSVPCQF